VGPDRRERDSRVLSPADRVLRLRAARRRVPRQPDRGRDHGVAVGQLSRGRGAAPRDPREGVELAARRPQRDPARREGDRRLPELDARGRRGEPRRLRRGDPAHRPGLSRRRLGREPVRRARRRRLHARSLRVDPHRDHARHRRPDRAGPRASRRREADHPHRPLSRRRGLHGWHGRRGHSGPRDRRPGRRPPGPVTTEIQKAYLDTVRGRTERWSHWLEYSPAAKTQA